MENCSAAKTTRSEAIDKIFDDPESRRNIVGLFDLLLKIDRRINPDLYKPKNGSEKTNEKHD